MNYLKKLYRQCSLYLFVLSVFTSANCLQANESSRKATQNYSEEAVKLKTDLRKLWEDHIVWTRNYIISSLADLEDAAKVAERLLLNQDDIGNAIKPYYGEEAAKKLSGLLRYHILIAVDVIKAAKENNAVNLANAQKRWTVNGKDIADFLSKANPHLNKNELEKMMATHLSLTTDEVVYRLKKDWAGDIVAYDKGHVHMLMFSDTLAMGIVKQFPKTFKTGPQ
ncbi:MAG: glycosyltransferase [Bdellovibrio sp.]|nr:glycosyltransferase [Bdellovibrio sp.]